jgi:hypothetical protein
VLFEQLTGPLRVLTAKVVLAPYATLRVPEKLQVPYSLAQAAAK